VPLQPLIEGLQCGRAYHYRAAAQQPGGPVVVGNDATFLTPGCPPGPPRIITGAALYRNKTALTLTGTVIPNGNATQSVFEWGTDGSYGKLTDSFATPASNSVAAVSYRITGLACGTEYYYRCELPSAVRRCDRGATQRRLYGTVGCAAGRSDSRAAPSRPVAAGPGNRAVCHGSVAAHRGSVAEYRGSVAEYRGSVAVYRGSVAVYRGSVAAHRGSVAEYRGSLAMYRGSVAAHRGSLAEYRSSVAEYRGSLA
jgi:hypothetical protein